MAGPLVGLGQQQVPLSQPYQPGGTDDNARNVRDRQEQNPQENKVQESRNAQPAQGNKVEQTNKQRPAPPPVKSASSNDNGQDDTAPRRGSVVNITV